MALSCNASHRQPVVAFWLLVVCVSPLGAGTVRAESARTIAAVRGQLVVRARAGLPSHLRRRLFAQHDTQEIGRIEALGASILRVPRTRLRRVAQGLRRSGYFKSVEPDYQASAAQIPNDPEFKHQWGLSKIKVPQAWDVTTGSSAITIAIVDSGIDATHPDLTNQVGAGYDFVNDDADPADDNGHGTRMAGIVAGEAFNGTGIAGVAPLCRLLPVKVLNSTAQGSYSAIASGIIFAADQGVRVINLSLTGPASAAIMESAVNYATARGVVVVAAAGNDGSSGPGYPAAYPNVVAVGASDAVDAIPAFSNSGSWLALAAPGVEILTTNRISSSGFVYATTTGTSPATAFVSGAFALLFSARPELSSASALAALTETARDLRSKGWDPYAGWGRINVAAALTAVAPPGATPVPTPPPDRVAPRVSITAPARNVVVSGDIAVDIAASDNVGVTRVELLADNRTMANDTAPPFSFIWDATTVSPGRHTLRARAYDAAGNAKLSKRLRVRVAP